MKHILFVLTIWVLQIQIFILYVDSYKLKCPSQANWKYRAKVKCNSVLTYFCLQNNAKGEFVEGCTGPDWDRKGSKRIFSGSFTRGKCIHNRFQPFIFQTNEGMSDCIYSKSICSEEGQIVNSDGSSKADRTCRCNYKKNYSFVKIPRNVCFCIPTEEDCACYIKSCPVNFTLSADYNCIQSGCVETRTCIDNIKHFAYLEEKTRVQTENKLLWLNETTSNFNWRSSITSLVNVLSCLCLIHIIGETVLTVLFIIWTSENPELFYRCFKMIHTGCHLLAVSFKRLREKLLELNRCNIRSQTADDADKEDVAEQDKLSMDIENLQNHITCKSTSVDKEPNNGYLRVKKELICVDVHKSFKPAVVKTDEVNFLRIVHLLFRVAYPAVLKIFNNVIPPDQLQKTFDKKKSVMENRYRGTQTIINDYKWGLLFGAVKGATLTSEYFDVRLVRCNLSTLGNIEVGDSYPDQSDTSIIATLYRIRHIQNNITQIFDGTLTDDQCIQYWDDIEQAVSKLVSSHEFEIENDPEERRPIDGLNNICTYFLIDWALPKRNRQFTDISPEENNFLLVFHGLTTIVYPVIRNQLKIHCPEDLLNKILREKDPKQLDLKIMIDILKQSTYKEGKKEYVDQLDVIDNIRREIVQSSSGVLNETRFKDILESIRKAVMYLGGEFYEKKLLKLQHISNILE